MIRAVGVGVGGSGYAENTLTSVYGLGVDTYL